MKNLLFIFLFVISAFAGEINIPKGVGDVDGAVYTADGKTLYTLKNETVTKWSVEPLKQLDTFETTVNHLRNYVSDNIDKEYLQKFVKYSYVEPLKLDEKNSKLTVFSYYITEEWDLKNKQLIIGEPRISHNVAIGYKKLSRKHSLYVSSHYYHKPINTIKISIDNKKAYEIYLNPNIWWSRSSSLSLTTDLKQEFLPKESYEVVVGMTDGMSLTYYFKEEQEKPYRVFFQKSQIDNPYEKVWQTNNPSEAIKAMYGTANSYPFQPSKYLTTRYGYAYMISIEDCLDFDSFLIYNSLEQNGALYPTMILNSNALNMTSRMQFRLNGNQLGKGSHGNIADVNFTLLGQTKDKKVYQWNVLIPGLVNLGADQ